MVNFQMEAMLSGKFHILLNLCGRSHMVLTLCASRSDYLGKARLLNGQTYSFLQVTGFEKQAQSGSFENQAEAHVVVELVQELQQNSHRNCVPGKWHSADRIRIITFYQAQVFLIKRLLFNRRLHDVVVATVDSSQGCEADIVIVSFVRSHGSHGKSSVGFLTDDRRMNVAITRGKAINCFFLFF